MPRTLRTLILEEQASEIELTLRELRQAGFAPEPRIVVTEGDYRAALESPLDVVLSAFALPDFDALAALAILRQRDSDLPFVIVDGAVGEDRAAQCIREGATDYVRKDRRHRLGPVIEDALRARDARREKRRAEESLRQDELFRRLIVEHSQDMLLIVEPDGKPRFLSPSVFTTFDRTPAEIEGRLVFDFVHPEDRETTLAAFAAALASPGVPLAAEFRMIHRDGSWRTIEALGENLVDDPEIRGIVVSGRDITRRVEAEHALRESEERFRELVNGVQEVFFLYDRDVTTTLFVSPAYERIWGRSCQSLYERPRSWLDLVHPDDLDRVRAALPGTNASGIEYRIVRDDGSIRSIRGRTFPVRNARGELYRIAGVAEDGTALKQAEAERPLQSAALGAAANAIVITDAEGRISWVNPAFTRLTGYASDEVLGRNPKLLQDPSFYEDLWRTIASGRPWHGELLNRRKDGTLYAEEQTITPVLEDGVIRHFIAIKQDVTERKESERRLRMALEKAQEAVHLKAAFLANMSHEIRTPLNVIVGYSNLIGESCADVDPGVHELVEGIDRASRRLIGTIHAIIDMAKLEAEAFDVHPVRLVLTPLVERVLDGFRSAAAKKGLDLRYETEDHGATVLFDEYCLEHAIANLIDNAIKFTPQGRVTVRLRRGEDGTLVLTVEDTGVGIDIRFIPGLFEPFSQEERGYSRRFEGNGLGLALTRRYLELGGATIDVESEKGKGSRFTIVLPRRPDVVSPTPAEAPDSPETRVVPEAPPVVLVVEDDPQVQRDAGAALAPHFRAVVAGSTEQARAALRVVPEIRAVLMNVSAGASMNGLALAREIRQHQDWRTLPIVATTDQAHPEDERHFRTAGCDAYVSRPLSPRRIVALLRRLTSHHGRRT